MNYLSSQSWFNCAVVILPSILTLHYRKFWAAGGVCQQMELRIGEHVTGSRSPIFLCRNTDSQSLFSTQVTKDPVNIQRADITVMRWDGGDEVVQQEVKWQCYSWNHQKGNDTDLVFSKPPNLSQQVLKLHLCWSNLLMWLKRRNECDMDLSLSNDKSTYTFTALV